ncbi:MAG: TonB-dependent receptor [Bacteroidota bacterium]
MFNLLLSGFLSAQNDSTIVLSSVEIKAAKITKANPGSHLQTIDSQFLALHSTANLAEILSRRTGIFFKTYGTGSLATASFRGSGASHTSILWNGFNLQNPMNGVMDFSLFPVGLADAVAVQHGGGSTLQGSGSLGGAIFLEDKLKLAGNDLSESFKLSERLARNDHFRSAFFLGNFGEVGLTGSLATSGEQVATSLKFFHRQAENDFPIANSGGKLQQNAHLKQWAISQSNLLKINEKQQLKSFLWLQNSTRRIPPSRTEANRHAQQDDEIFRLGFEWTRLSERGVTKARAGYFNEAILYFSDLVDSSQSRSHTWIGEAEQAWFFGKNQILRAGLHLTRQQAKTIETGEQRRNRSAVFTAWQQLFWKGKLAWSLEARQEAMDEKLIPFVASSGLEMRLGEHWKLLGRVAKNYNVPTFNDLYWQDAFAKGNPDLQPETAWSQEAGIHFQSASPSDGVTSSHPVTYKAGLTAFSNRVENWILWSPAGAIFQPENRRSVWARGMESYLEMNWKSGDWQVFTYLNASLTRSTVEKIYRQETPALLGKQLIYVPVRQGNAGFTLFFNSVFLDYGHSFTSQIFTKNDNSSASELPGFQVAALKLGKVFTWKTCRLHLQGAVENIWNEDYEVIEARPMPGRSFRLEIKLTAF